MSPSINGILNWDNIFGRILGSIKKTLRSMPTSNIILPVQIKVHKDAHTGVRIHKSL